MESRAVARHVRIAPRKVRLVVDLVRGKRVEEALNVLDLTPKRAARIVAKALRSAVANAENTQSVDVDRLYLKKALVDEGPAARRFRSRAQGRAYRVARRNTHLTLILDERESR
jgi:large subunit ribosomal protein L22